MNARKRALSLALVCLICVGMLTVGATASEEADEDVKIIETQEDETVIDEIEESSSSDATFLEESTGDDSETVGDVVIETEESEEETGDLKEYYDGFGFTDDYVVGTEPIIDYGEIDHYGNPSVPIKMDLTELYSYAFEVLDLINEERTSRGLNPVIMDETLLESAMQRAAETAFGWSHTRQNGNGFYTINSMIRITGENIASFYRNPADAVEAWMNSEGHRANILYEDDVAIGVGVIKIGNSFFWVTDHATVMYEEADRNDYADVETSRTIYVADWDYSDGTNSIDSQVTISLSSDTLVVGETSNILVKFVSTVMTDRYDLPASGLIMTSSDESVATVSEDGVVTGVGPGKATITAYYPNRETKATTFEVTVKTREQADADLNDYANANNVNLTLEVTSLYDEAFARLDAINSLREENGLPALEMDTTLLDAAMATAKEQLIRIGDTKPNGVSLDDAYSGLYTEKYVVGRASIGKNAPANISSWVKYVTGFEDMILSTEHTAVGIGIVCTEISSGYKNYAVAYFFNDDEADTAFGSSYSNANESVDVATKIDYAASAMTFDDTATVMEDDKIQITGTVGNGGKIRYAVVTSADIVGTSEDTSIAYVENGYIYGVSAGTTTITLSFAGDDTTTFPMEVTVVAGDNQDENKVLGDVNQDGIVDVQDLTLLFQYVSGQGGEIYEAAADVTGDGIIDLKDVTRLMQYVDGQIDTL